MIKASYCKVKDIVTIKLSRDTYNDLGSETDEELETVNKILDECDRAINNTLQASSRLNTDQMECTTQEFSNTFMNDFTPRFL